MDTTGWTGRRRLGRSGLEVSALGLGGWAIGGAMAAGEQPLGYAGVDDAESLAAITLGVEAGITLFDTADAYGAGHSERLLGRALAGHPDVLVATKFGNTIDEATRQLTGVDVRPEYVRRALDGSLGRLGRDRVDLYQLHTPDVTEDQADDLIEVLEDLAAAGSLAWWGVSTDDPAKARRFASAPHCTAMQLQLNLFDPADEVLEVCAEYDLAALGRSPLAMGLLGGRYDAGSTLPADDVRGRQPDWLTWFRDGRPAPRFLAAIDAVREALTVDGRTLAQGALGWVWARDERTIPLPGFRNRAQVRENAGALGFGPLPADAFAAVERSLGRAVAEPRGMSPVLLEPGEAAARTGLSLDTLRYYEREGLVGPIGRAPGGARRYSEDDLVWLGLVTCLRDAGLGIADLRRFTDLLRTEAASDDRVDFLRRRRAELEERQAALAAAIAVLDGKIRHYS